MPTPWTVYELVKAISDYDSAWKEFMLIDMGGATTDVYSASANTLSPIPSCMVFLNRSSNVP